MTFVATDSEAAESTTWLTPLSLVRTLGEFDLDPCGYPGHDTAKTLFCLPERDGLECAWFGRVWLNPPYGKEAKTWLGRLDVHGNGIALIFGRLETKWIQPFLSNGFFQLEGRINFISDRGGKTGNAGAPSILIPFGRKNIGSILSSDLHGRWFQ
jgi:hypothetical protein